jgi:hypothetical protein
MTDDGDAMRLHTTNNKIHIQPQQSKNSIDASVNQSGCVQFAGVVSVVCPLILDFRAHAKRDMR